jgi:Skp family chaperone for outer membrane proteins
MKYGLALVLALLGFECRAIMDNPRINAAFVAVRKVEAADAELKRSDAELKQRAEELVAADAELKRNDAKLKAADAKLKAASDSLMVTCAARH